MQSYAHSKFVKTIASFLDYYCEEQAGNIFIILQNHWGEIFNFFINSRYGAYIEIKDNRNFSLVLQNVCLMIYKINVTQKKGFPYLRKDLPSISRAAPATSNANLWLVVVAPGTSWTRPTTSTTAPNNRHTTTACNPDICRQRSSSGDEYAYFHCRFRRLYILYIHYYIVHKFPNILKYKIKIHSLSFCLIQL